MNILDTKIYEVDIESGLIFETTIRQAGGGENFWETEASKGYYRTREDAEKSILDLLDLGCCG